MNCAQLSRMLQNHAELSMTVDDSFITHHDCAFTAFTVLFHLFGIQTPITYFFLIIYI
jgi:hypothetical protein